MFLACLALLDQQGTPVSASKNAGNYAPKIMAPMDQANGVRVRDLEAAMNRLLSNGQIINQNYGAGGRSRKISRAPEAA